MTPKSATRRANDGTVAHLRCSDLGILLCCAAEVDAADRIAPAIPQFFALSVPDAVRSADWYRRAFGLEVRGEIKPPDGAAHVIIPASDELLVEILAA